MPKRGERRDTTAGALPEIREQLTSWRHDPNEAERLVSAREEDVARLLLKGVSNKEIARTLGVEVVTVKKHVGSI